MTYVFLAFLIFWSGYAAHRFWIGPALKRRRARQRFKRLGIHAFMV